jgi:hypothetical protein
MSYYGEAVIKTFRKGGIPMCLRHILKVIVMLGAVLIFASSVWAQQEVTAPKGILIGANYNTQTKELDSVFTNQSEIEFGAANEVKVCLWTDIRDGAGLELTWVVEYANGLREEVLTQSIKSSRYRTYIQKTFRKKILDQASKKYVDTIGPCKIQLVDKNNNKVIVEKVVTLK